MANKFAKKDIDFEVYQKDDPASVVDWGKAAQDITKTFEGIRDERQKKKDAIEKSFQDQQTALQDIGEYDNPTIQQLVMNGGQDVSNKLLDVKNLVQRGLMKPSDATMWQHNATTGFNLLKKNAQQYDKTFQEYTARVQETGPNGFSLSAPGEVWQAKQLEGFANMNNMSLQADSATGNMVMLRLDEKGEPIPGESMSVQHMSLLMKQKIDNFDSTASLEEIKKSMGTIITADIDPQGIRTDITTEERSRAETEFFATEGGQEFLEIKTNEFLANPPGFNQQSLMVNAGLTTSKGETYAIGSQEEYDKWNEDNPGDEENNPVLRMVFGEDNLYRPEFNDAQDEAARAHASQMITGSLDVKETAKSQHIEKRVQPQPSAASLAGKKEEDAKSSKLGDYIVMLTDEDPEKRAAVEETLRNSRNAAIEKHNSKVSNDADKLPTIQETTPGTQSIATQADVDNGLADNVGDTVITNRKLILSDGKEIEIKGTFTEQTRILDAIYDPDNMLTTDDIVKLAADRDFDLETEITSKKDKSKSSKAAYAVPDYTKEIQIGDSLETAESYIKDNFGVKGGDGSFNWTVDTTEGIAGGYEEMIIGAIDPAIMSYFNKTPGMQFSIDWKGEASNGDDIIVFNFGGMTYEIGNTDKEGETALYDINAQQLWKDLQSNLLNPAINKLNKERTGGDADYEL